MECTICLSGLKSPVVLPCGHLHCKKCLTEYIDAGADAMRSTCPSCRAAFNLVTPDLALVPEKYHPFIQPAVRRVYLDTAEARADRERLQARIAALERDKAQVMHRAESAMRRADVCADGERQARVALEKKKAELARAAAENDRIRKRLEDAEDREAVTAQRLRAENEQLKKDLEELEAENAPRRRQPPPGHARPDMSSSYKPVFPGSSQAAPSALSMFSSAAVSPTQDVQAAEAPARGPFLDLRTALFRSLGPRSAPRAEPADARPVESRPAELSLGVSVTLDGPARKLKPLPRRSHADPLPSSSKALRHDAGSSRSARGAPLAAANMSSLRSTAREPSMASSTSSLVSSASARTIQYTRSFTQALVSDSESDTDLD